MAATVQISETNGASPGTRTDSITNSNKGSTDAVNLVPATYPIIAGQNSYEKWQQIKLVSLGGSVKIKSLRMWRTGALSGSDVLKGNQHETQGTYDTHKKTAYETPVATTSTIGVNTMPTSAPSNPNLGIAGSLTGELTADGTYSDYLVHQLQVNAGTTQGASYTDNYQYDEVA